MRVKERDLRKLIYALVKNKNFKNYLKVFFKLVNIYIYIYIYMKKLIYIFLLFFSKSPYKNVSQKRPSILNILLVKLVLQNLIP